MNVFEKNITDYKTFFAGCDLLRQGHLNIEMKRSFEEEERLATNNVFRGTNVFVSPNFVTPMWFIRALRKHSKVIHSYDVCGSTGKHTWITDFSTGKVNIEPWEYGEKRITVDIALVIDGRLLFFTAYVRE